MSQPIWELIYSTDCSALYRDTTGVYPPELTIAQTDDDADEDDLDATVAHVYRFPLERCWQVTRPDEMGWVSTFLCEQDPARESELPYPLHMYKPWYAKYLKSMADSAGEEIGNLVASLCSDDPRDLSDAYHIIGGHSGFNNFNEYPEEWTASEFAAWPERGVKLSSDERDKFAEGYVTCALWCGVMTYKHADDCPCHEPNANGDAYDAELCDCTPEAESSGQKYNESRLTDDARETLTSDAHDFYADNVADLRASTLTMERAGHDFWLTRNHHGAGFWDEKSRGADADAALDRLTEASHACGEMTLVEGANTKIDVL